MPFPGIEGPPPPAALPATATPQAAKVLPRNSPPRGEAGMPSEPSEPATATAQVSAPADRTKFRVRFRKAGDLRLVSHHDLLHCVERMFRRAALPVSATQGFNPRPRVSFAQSLALGVIGLNEVLEL